MDERHQRLDVHNGLLDVVRALGRQVGAVVNKGQCSHRGGVDDGIRQPDGDAEKLNQVSQTERGKPA